MPTVVVTGFVVTQNSQSLNLLIEG